MTDPAIAPKPAPAINERSAIGRNTGNQIASSKEAMRKLGGDPASVIAAVETANAKMREAKAASAPKPEVVDHPPDEEVPPTEDPPASPPETPAAPTPTPAPAKKETPDLVAMRAREAKLVEGQQRLSRQQKEFDDYRRRTEGELAAARESSRLAKADPNAWFEKYHGVKLSQVGLQAPPPAAAPPPEVSQALEELRRERATVAQERHAKRQEDELDKFAQEAKAGAVKWPLASKYSPEKLKARGWNLALTHGGQGVTLSNEEILDKIEEELSEIAQLAAPPKRAVTSTPKPSPSPGPQASSTAQPTLTSRGAHEPDARPSLTNLSRRTQREATVRAVEEARKAAEARRIV